jgi:hypothetical protein
MHVDLGNIPVTMPQDSYEKFIEVDKTIPIFTKYEAQQMGFKWYKASNKCTSIHKDFTMPHPNYRWLSGGCIVYYLFKRMPCPRCKAPEKIYRTHKGDPDYICEDCRRELRWASIEEINQARAYAAPYVRKYKKEIDYTCEILDLQCVPNFFEVHHKLSVNIHPELAAEFDNMVGLYKPIHRNFHRIYGNGNNTPNQFNEYERRINKSTREHDFSLLGARPLSVPYTPKPLLRE